MDNVVINIATLQIDEFIINIINQVERVTINIVESTTPPVGSGGLSLLEAPPLDYVPDLEEVPL